MTDSMGSRIRVPPELEFAGARLKSTADELVDMLATLKAKLVPLEESWVGEAREEYVGLQGQWNAGANGLFGVDGALGDIANAANLAWNNYSEAEFSNLRTWRG
ncbi:MULTISPECIES: WXG100 family type VII secretion target [unclassified Micromonospora]|uniref:WXG100 family type VII secretion target n=1 Tax=unclassified Micromonospora TaxID=2617518 RepID=UPI0010343CA3|nr:MULTISPECIES: WXG100 family type VII secretion target [unclassified Micromonospora]QKW11933.1 WXG100 family type VII secretion target [Verrucosispora sp. NA02020]TBL43338.1 WXG100 family type VII secretion target [Verrucosispora sp. SN26_14.1]